MVKAGTFAFWPVGAESWLQARARMHVARRQGCWCTRCAANACTCTLLSLRSALLTKIPKVTASQPRKEQRSSTCTGRFSTKPTSVQIALKPKSFTYKCAYITEIMTSFLKVINKQTVSKVGKGKGRENRSAGSRIWSRRKLKYTKILWFILLNSLIELGQ